MKDNILVKKRKKYPNAYFKSSTVLSIELCNLEIYLKDNLESFETVRAYYRDNDCRVILTVRNEVPYEAAFKGLQEQLGLKEDIEEYEGITGENIFKLTLNDFKPMIEDNLNVNISSGCLNDEINDIIYLFYTDRD